ncbi:MAG: hypothetical protein QNJ98_02305 [Planctomycetota bacterium]|nr:hypothetical protein [Planctomycetota bacterium]
MITALITLVLTILVETVVACLVLPRDRRRLRIDVPLINLTTHPLATIAVATVAAPFLFVELVVIAAEVVGYRVVTGFSLRKAVWLSFGLNGITIVLSFVYRAVVGGG